MGTREISMKRHSRATAAHVWPIEHVGVYGRDSSERALLTVDICGLLAFFGFRMAVTLAILQGYYPVVSSLQTYLADRVDFSGSSLLLRSEDTPSFTTLVRGTYVATDANLADNKRFSAKPPMVHLHEVIY